MTQFLAALETTHPPQEPDPHADQIRAAIAETNRIAARLATADPGASRGETGWTPGTRLPEQIRPIVKAASDAFEHPGLELCDHIRAAITAGTSTPARWHTASPGWLGCLLPDCGPALPPAGQAACALCAAVPGSADGLRTWRTAISTYIFTALLCGDCDTRITKTPGPGKAEHK